MNCRCIFISSKFGRLGIGNWLNWRGVCYSSVHISSSRACGLPEYISVDLYLSLSFSFVMPVSQQSNQLTA